MKSVRIRSFSGLYFVNLRIQSKCGRMRTTKTPNTDAFFALGAICTSSQRLRARLRSLTVFSTHVCISLHLNVFQAVLTTEMHVLNGISYICCNMTSYMLALLVHCHVLRFFASLICVYSE